MTAHHVYKDIWSPYVNEELTNVVEENNTHDPNVVAVKKGTQIVGHLPRIISATCSLFLHRNGVISATITDGRRCSIDLPQGGLEVPCVLKLTGESATYVEKVKKLLLAQKPMDRNQLQRKERYRLLMLEVKTFLWMMFGSGLVV